MQGDTVTIFPLKGSLELLDSFLKVGVVVDLTLHKKNFINQVLICNFTDLLKFDVIHCHLPQSELLLALVYGKNPIVTRHFGGAFYPRTNKFFSTVLSRVALRKAASVIAISNFVASYLRSSKECSASKLISVVEYGFEPQIFLQDKKMKKPQHLRNNQKLIFGTLARLSPEKDLRTLIIAASKASNQSELDFSVRIFGGGPLRSELQQIISESGMLNRVQLFGRTMNPIDALYTFDVFVLTSIFEGFGMVLLEAMSIGLPIICSRIPSSVEILGESGAAIFFQQGDSKDLSEKMSNISKFLNPNYQLEQSKRLELYRSKAMLTKINAVYRQFMSDPVSR